MGPPPVSTAPAADRGLYVLVLSLERPRRLSVGALGTVRLPAGGYLYVGSARRALGARLRRHLQGPRRLHWHIDHLTRRKDVRRLGAVILSQGPGGAEGAEGAEGADGAEGPLSECALNQRVGLLVGGDTPVPGFGASDCRAGCPAHLWHVPSSPAPTWLAARLGGAVFDPG